MLNGRGATGHEATGLRPAESGNGHAPPAAGPVVRRRRGLPGTRAVFGGLLVAAAAVGLFAGYSRAGEGPRHSYVVARHALSPGARLQPGDLALARMDLPASLRARSFDDRSVLVGATVISPVAAGELLQASAVVAAGGDAAYREITFSLERGRISAGVKDGERVDVLGTYGDGSDAVTAVVVRDALILSIERSRGSLADATASVVTLGLDDPSDVLAMAHASHLAKVTLVRSTGAPPLPPGAGAATYRTPTESR